MAISLGQDESRPAACGGLEEGDAAATLECCTALRLRRAHTSNTFTCFCSKDFAFVPGRDRGRVGWPIGLGVGCSPYPVLPATLPQAAALPAVAPALAAARQQRNEPAQGQRAVRAAQRAEPAPAPAQLGLGAQPPT